MKPAEVRQTDVEQDPRKLCHLPPPLLVCRNTISRKKHIRILEETITHHVDYQLCGTFGDEGLKTRKQSCLEWIETGLLEAPECEHPSFAIGKEVKLSHAGSGDRCCGLQWRREHDV